MSFTPSTANARLIINRTVIHDNTVGAGLACCRQQRGAVTVRNSSIDDNWTGVAANRAPRRSRS